MEKWIFSWALRTKSASYSLGWADVPVNLKRFGRSLRERLCGCHVLGVTVEGHI
jgi:hypothetical protein